MIVCRFTLPLMDNDGFPLTKVHEKLRSDLVDIAGGFTEHVANGYWKDAKGKLHRELVAVYEVATDDIDGVEHAATVAAIGGRQDALYFAAGGRAEIIDLK